MIWKSVMSRRLVTVLCLVLALCPALSLSTASPAGAVVQARLTDDERAALDKAEAALSGVTTMRARFQQVTSHGGYAEGDVMIQRPGKMRLQYDPPADVLIVADGTFLIYADLDLRQVSHIGLSQTPAGLLLRKDVSFSDPDVTVTDVRREDGRIEIDAVMTDDPASGTLTLVFQEDPFTLRQWRVLDADGVETTVALSDIKTGVTFDQSLFRHIANPAALPKKP